MFPRASLVSLALRVAVLPVVVMLALAAGCGGGAMPSQETGSGTVAATVESEAVVTKIPTPDEVAATQAVPTATAVVVTPTPEPSPTPTPVPPTETATPVETPTLQVPAPAPTDPPPAAATVAPETDDGHPIVAIGSASFVVDVADTRAAQQQGLSGRESLAEGTGMLFVFDQERLLTFWMKEMNFPLDMVWIDASCTVVDISRDVPIPEPGQTLADLPTYGPEAPAKYVLEINAGTSAAAGFGPGDTAVFKGGLEGKYGC